MAVRTAWLINDTMSGEDIRIGLTADTIHDTAIRSRSGVIPAPSDPLKVAIGSGMVVNMNAGQIKVGGQRAATQGEAVITNDANLAFTLANGDPAQPRIDVVVAYVRDTAYSDTTLASGFAVIQGTPGASPAIPTITGTAALGTGIAIARIQVPANASAGGGGLTGAGAILTDARVFTGSPGGRVTVASYATLPAAPYDGLEAYTSDTGGTWIYRQSITAWRLTGPLLVANFASLAGLAGVYSGMQAYTLDTFAEHVYNGSVWIGKPLGYIASASGPASTTNFTTQSVAASVTVNVVSGRKYAIKATFQGQQITNAGVATAQIYNGVTKIGNVKFDSVTYGAASNLSGTGEVLYVAGSTGSQTFSVQCASTAASLNVTSNGATIWVEDIGTG